MKKIKSALVGLFLVLGICGQASFANTITSNDPDCEGPLIGRVFSVTATTVNKCLLKGEGNINGGNGGAADTGFISSGWVFLENSGDPFNGWLTVSGGGSTSGSFIISGAAYSSYDKIAIGFKSGEGQFNPDWAIFELASATLSGNWSIAPNRAGALSHAILYGFGTPGGGGGGGGGNVPEPASLALMGLGLLGLARVRSRRA